MFHRIKEIRESKGYTQQQVADALFMSQNSYSNLENGKSKLDVEKLIKISEFFGVEPLEILSNNGLNVTYNDKVETAYNSHNQTLNSLDSSILEILKEQLTIKDKQIEDLLTLVKSLTTKSI